MCSIHWWKDLLKSQSLYILLPIFLWISFKESLMIGLACFATWFRSWHLVLLQLKKFYQLWQKQIFITSVLIQDTDLPLLEFSNFFSGSWDLIIFNFPVVKNFLPTLKTLFKTSNSQFNLIWDFKIQNILYKWLVFIYKWRTNPLSF